MRRKFALPPVGSPAIASARVRSKIGTKALTSLLALSLVAPAAIAQTTGTSIDPTKPAPPAGQYAPPPTGAEGTGASYDSRAQYYDRDYADRYSQWASRNCVDRRSNTAAGALIGGVVGAVAGSGLAGRGDHAAGPSPEVRWALPLGPRSARTRVTRLPAPQATPSPQARRPFIISRAIPRPSSTVQHGISRGPGSMGIGSIGPTATGTGPTEPIGVPTGGPDPGSIIIIAGEAGLGRSRSNQP